MSEITLQWIQALKLIILCVFATLYGFGGVSGKWKRRFVAPVLYVIGVSGVSIWTSTFNVWYLLCAPLFFGGLSLGYGATTTGEKIKKRAIAGSACACATLPIFIVNQVYDLLCLHILVCVLTSVIAGVWNRTSSARAEETLIGATYGLIPLFII
jgi:hypothetical protein